MKEKNHEETKLQSEIMIALSQYGIPIRQQCGKFKTMYGGIISIGIPGMSDILFFRNDGKPFWLEIKTNKGRPSKEQLHFLEVMKSIHVEASIIRSVEEAINFIKNKVPID